MENETRDDRLNGKRVVISSTGDSIDSPLDPRFGRCSHFIIVESDGSYYAIRNPGQDSGGGAGTLAAQKVVDLGGAIVITGNMGPNAFRVLDASGIPVFTKMIGTVGAAMDSFRNGELSKMKSWTSPGHHGHGSHGPNTGSS